MYVPRAENVSFVAKFTDYSDAIHPFMYHCHFSNHEDDGMMGQFVVTGTAGIPSPSPAAAAFTAFPNPATDRLFLNMKQPGAKAYYVTVFDALGRMKYMLPRPELQSGIDISSLSPGAYTVQLMEEATKSVASAKFIKD